MSPATLSRPTRRRATPARSSSVAVAARWLTAGTAALVAGASAAGLWSDGIYQDAAPVVAMLRGYDLVTLVLVAPLLAATLLPALRDRPRALLLRISMLAFCVYNYAYYLFGTELNAALLAHVALFTLGLYALVLSLMSADVAGLAHRFRSRTPVRTVAAVLVLLGAPLAALQLSGLLGYALTGAVPAEPSSLVVPVTLTRLGAVLDLSLLVPTYLLAAVLLWRRHGWGYLLATMGLVAGMMHQVSYLTGMLFQIRADVPGAAFDPFEPVIALLFLGGSALLIAHVRTDTSSAPPTPPRDGGLVGRAARA